MPDILFDTTHITRDELEQYTGILKRLINGEIGLKRLIGITHEGQPVYRLKIDKKNRLAFRFVDFQGKRVPLILASNEHKYEKLRKQLSNPAPDYIDSYSLPEETPLAKTSLEIKPAVALSRQILVLDEHQYQALQCHLPLLLMGPPGSGKTVLLFQIVKRMLHLESVRNQTILYISRSRDLLDKLNEQLLTEDIPEGPIVVFKTWTELLEEAYPQWQLASKYDFNQWLKTCKNITLPPPIIYYELSLIQSMGTKQYLELGLRQSHVSNNPEKQKMLLSLLPKWLEYLQKHKLYDEMVTPLPPNHRSYDVIVCEELQNLSPLVMSQLMKLALEKNFLTCVDTEQNTDLAGNFLGGIKAQMHQNFGKYTKLNLPTVWRSDPEIIAFANKLLEFKYTLAGKSKRRIYSSLKSAMPSNKGTVKWVKLEELDKIDLLATRVTPIIYNGTLSPALKTLLTQHNFHYFLTPEQAVGLEFDTIICVNFWSQGLHHFTKKNQNIDLPPENEIRINKLFVTLTRAIHGVYFIDQVQDFATKINELLNLNLAHHAEETPPVKNELDTRKQWEKLAEHHLKKGEHEIAHSILSSYLNQSGQMMPEQLNPVPAQQLSNKKARYLQKDNKKTLDNKKIELNSPQSPAPAKPKRTPKQYCQDLVEGITVNNLNNLFMNPHLVSLLFEYPVKNGDILFIHLKNSKFKKEFNLLFLLYKKEILNALSLERLAKPINSEHKEPLFFHLCRTFEGITILENLPNIIYTTFPYEILFYKMPIQSDFHPNTTPFFWLSISTLGQGLLHKILKLNPKLVSRITPQDLAGHTITYKNITLYLSSVNFLSHSLCGHQIIKILLENKKLAEENHLHLSTKAIKPLHTITTSFSAVSLRNYLQQLEQIFSLMAYEDLAIIHLANPEGLNLSLSYIPSETNRWHLLVLNDYPPKFLPCVGTALIDDIYEGFSRTCSDSDKFILNSTICLSSNALSRNKIQKGLKKIRIKMNELKAEEICPLMATYDDIEGIKNYFNKMNHATKKLCLEKAVINNSKQVFFELFSHAVQAALELDFVEQLLQFTLMPDAKEILSALINTPCLKGSRFNFTEFAFKAIRIGSNKIFKKLMEQKTLPINAILNENTMATLACLYGREKILDLLMLNGINLNAGAADGRSPLHIAAQEGYVDIVKRLIQAQADINSLGVENVTPLFLAACNGHIEVVELLLRCGADISKPRLFTVKSLRDFLKLKKIDYPIEAKGDDQILTITPRKIARLLRLDSIVTLIDQYKPKKNIRLIAAQEISEEESMNKGITNSTAIKK